VVAPYSASDAKGLLKTSIRDPNPVVFLENEMLYGQSFEVPKDADYLVPLGKASVVREGCDVTLVAFSITVGMALKAADALASLNIQAEVLDLRTLRPLDTATILKSLRKTHRIVTVEEGWPYAGIGAEIFAQICEHGFDELDAPPLRVTGEDVPLPYAANLEKLALPSVEKIVGAVKSVCHL
jgi:pyruvate dehydrogenase E1 component beta subunit